VVNEDGLHALLPLATPIDQRVPQADPGAQLASDTEQRPTSNFDEYRACLRLSGNSRLARYGGGNLQ
jgi:hypothetical protein